VRRANGKGAPQSAGMRVELEVKGAGDLLAFCSCMPEQVSASPPDPECDQPWCRLRRWLLMPPPLTGEPQLRPRMGPLAKRGSMPGRVQEERVGQTDRQTDRLSHGSLDGCGAAPSRRGS
jgi:hypothetical protein